MPVNTTLKQRLANLSLANSAPSSPTSSHSTLRLPLLKKKTLFTPPWNRRVPDPAIGTEGESRERIQDVMGKLVFQAGVDFEYVEHDLIPEQF